VPTSTLTQIFKRMAMPCAPRASASALAVALGALACLPIALCPTERAKDPATPAAALAAAGAMGVSGPVFNEFGFGGYLIFKGVPTFIDGRMELYGNEFLDRYLAAQRGAQPALSELLDRYHIAWTFLSPDAGAVMQLDQLPGWRRAYADDQAVIHVRDGGPRVDRCVSERGNRGLD
jgi:hypothetical protein